MKQTSLFSANNEYGFNALTLDCDMNRAARRGAARRGAAIMIVHTVQVGDVTDQSPTTIAAGRPASYRDVISDPPAPRSNLSLIRTEVMW